MSTTLFGLVRLFGKWAIPVSVRCRHGAAAVVGEETVQYVGNIYKYYVVYSTLLSEKCADGARQAKSSTLHIDGTTGLGARAKARPVAKFHD